MLLIDDRPPPPSEPSRPVWEPDWALVAWIVAAVAAGVACFATGGVASFVLLCLTMACAGQVVARVLPHVGGMRDYHQ
jgi:hypothetical protein